MEFLSKHKFAVILVIAAVAGTLIYLLRFHKKTAATIQQQAAITEKENGNYLKWGAGSFDDAGNYIPSASSNIKDIQSKPM